MVRCLIRRLRTRRAISDLVGGLIVLTVLLTALAAMNFVSQEFFQYQQIAANMAQYRNQQQVEEELVINSPGMIFNPAWNGCGGCNMYNISLSNSGSIGIQIVQIYINSTGPAGTGCNPKVCILSPSSSTTSYGFSQAQSFINPGESSPVGSTLTFQHYLLFYLPSSLTLPNPTPAFPENTVALVTARGSVFSFQWPFQPQTFGQSQSAFSSGNMKIAYVGSSGFDSKNEPGPVASNSGGVNEGSGTGYCHKETTPQLGENYPTPTGYAEELTGLESGSTVFGDSGVLWFVNPWVTTSYSGSGTCKDVMCSAANGQTTMYIYVVVANSGNTAYTPSAGTIDLTWYGSNHIDGYLIGIYYEGGFYCTSCSPPTTYSIPAGFAYYAIFKITIFSIGNWPANIDPGASIMFWGAASLTDAPGSSNEAQNYYSGTILLSGLSVHQVATSGGCS